MQAPPDLPSLYRLMKAQGALLPFRTLVACRLDFTP